MTYGASASRSTNNLHDRQRIGKPLHQQLIWPHNKIICRSHGSNIGLGPRVNHAMDSVHRIKLVLSMQWPRYTEAMAASSGMETCVAHTMAPACRSRGFTIGSSNLIMCIQCAGIPELFFLSILFGSMLPVSTNRGSKRKSMPQSLRIFRPFTQSSASWSLSSVLSVSSALSCACRRGPPMASRARWWPPGSLCASTRALHGESIYAICLTRNQNTNPIIKLNRIMKPGILHTYQFCIYVICLTQNQNTNPIIKSNRRMEPDILHTHQFCIYAICLTRNQNTNPIIKLNRRMKPDIVHTYQFCIYAVCLTRNQNTNPNIKSNIRMKPDILHTYQFCMYGFA